MMTRPQPVLSGARILCEHYAARAARHVEITVVCEDWEVVMGFEYLNLSVAGITRGCIGSLWE